MKTFGYPEALHALFQLKHEVVLTSSMNSWFLKVYHDTNNPFSTYPVAVRIQRMQSGKTMRQPWQPNNADMHSSSFALKGGAELPLVRLIKGTSAWAFDLMLRKRGCIRRVDWPAGMHLYDKRIDECTAIQLVLSNGKEIVDEFRPDFADIAGDWESYF